VIEALDEAGREAYRRTAAWLETEEAQDGLRDALERAAETVEQLQEARAVSEETLHTRITI